MDIKLFVKRFQKIPVVHFENKVSKRPLISVCIITYQHKRYIVECLDSILRQNTIYSYEILLFEDESTDGTREICKKYAKNNPKKIRLFLNKRENNIKINGIETGRFGIIYNLLNANGKYIALCEGDDYWNDDFKLNKQAEILEKYKKDVILSNYSFLVDNKISEWTSLPTPKHLTSLSHNMLKYNDYHFSHLSTFFFHRSFINKLVQHPFVFKSWGIDTLLMPLFFENGTVFYLNEKLSVYRLNDKGISSKKEKSKKSIHKFKALQYGKLKSYHQEYSKQIEYKQDVATLKFFTRSLGLLSVKTLTMAVLRQVIRGEIKFIIIETSLLLKILLKRFIKG